MNQGTLAHVENNIISHVEHHGIIYQGLGNGTITGNTISYVGESSEMGNGIMVTGPQNITTSGNRIENIFNHGIFYGPAIVTGTIEKNAIAKTGGDLIKAAGLNLLVTSESSGFIPQQAIATPKKS